MSRSTPAHEGSTASAVKAGGVVSGCTTPASAAVSCVQPAVATRTTLRTAARSVGAGASTYASYRNPARVRALFLYPPVTPVSGACGYGHRRHTCCSELMLRHATCPVDD